MNADHGDQRTGEPSADAPDEAHGSATPRWSDDELLRAYLAERSETCPSCRYSLRGLTGRYCPECGQGLVLRVGLETPNLGAFIAGLVALAAAAGFGGLFLLLIAVMSMLARGSGGPEGDVYATFLGVTVISAILLALWVRKSGAIRRSRQAVRIALVVACCAYDLVVLFAVVLIIGPP